MTVQNAAQRTQLLISQKGTEILAQARVAVIGTGGVGGFCVEALARSGIGTLILVDKDTVEPSNINRQLCATVDTIGRVKVDVLKERIASINPDCEVLVYHAFYDETMNGELLAARPDYIIDCIDSLKSKKDLIRFCLDQNIPFLVSTGTARKKDPVRLKITEIENTSYDPLAKNLRVWKRKEKIKEKIRVVFSDEKPVDMEAGQPLPSMIFVPAAAGILLASTCVQDLLNAKEQ